MSIDTVRAAANAESALALQSRTDYQAFWRCRSDAGWLERVHEQLWAWLSSRKGIDVDVKQPYVHEVLLGVGQEVTISNHQSAQDQLMRAQLVETNQKNGTWTTELLALEDRSGTGWVWLSVRNDRGQYVAVPGLARALLDVLPLGDGLSSPQPEASVVRSSDVDLLVDGIVDPQRRGLVFVAGTATDDVPFEPFVKRVRHWTRDVVGLAQVVVLDPHATAALAERFAPLHAPEWTIRTYLPGLDVDEPGAAHRHRILGTESLGKFSDARIRALLGAVARANTTHHQGPTEVTRARRQLQRLRNRELRMALGDGAALRPPEQEPYVVEPTASREPRTMDKPAVEAVSEAGGLRSLVQEVLGLKVVDEPTLRVLRAQLDRQRFAENAVTELTNRIDEYQAELEQRDDAIDGLQTALEDAQLDSGILDEENGHLREHVRWLQNQFTAQRDYLTANSTVPDAERTTYPAGYPELVERLGSLEPFGVMLTADEGKILDLANHDHTDQCLRNVWDAVLMLVDYRKAWKAGDATGGMKHYLDHTPPGYRGITPGKFAATESEQTMARFGHLREFPVPEEVAESGTATMRAHVKLAKIGMVSPRLYFLDDLAKSDKIVVGYVGPHLPNTQTN